MKTQNKTAQGQGYVNLAMAAQNNAERADKALRDAAPDLLSALVNIEHVLSRMAEANPAINPFPLAEARAAIAKATQQ